MKKIFLIISIALLFGATERPAGITYFVKSNGGTGSGTDDANAWSYAKLNATPLSATDIVQFKSGDTLYGPLTVYSGVTYKSYGSGAKPVITGFTKLTSWTNVGTNLWEASVAAGSALTMVTVGGVEVEPGRFPNTGWLPMNVPDTNSGGQKVGSTRRFYTNTSNPSVYAGGKVVIKKREWAIEKHPITTVAGDSIIYDGGGSGFVVLDTWGYFITESNATLDQQNEWNYTAGSPGTLRMYSVGTPSALNVKASTVTTLVTMNSLNNVRFQDLTFEGTNGQMFTINNGSSNVMVNDTIQLAGTHALNATGMQSFVMDGCVVRYTNYSAINAIGGSRHKFVNNDISYAGMLKSLCGPNNAANHGLLIAGTKDTARGNIISYTGYNGIYFAGDSQIIKQNYIHHYMQTCADGGGIYNGSEPGGKGRLIDSNIVVYGLGPRDGTPFTGFDNAMGMYVDESSAGITVSNNFFGFNNGSGMYIHIGFDITVVNNTFYGNTHRQFYAAEDGPTGTKIRNIIFTGNVLHSLSSSDYVYFFYAVGSIDTFFTKMERNIVSRPSASSNLIGMSINYNTPVTYSLASWQALNGRYDRQSSGTPAEFVSGTPYIETSFRNTSTIQLSSMYKSIRGTEYKVGILTLPPFTAQVLVSTGAIPTFNTVPYLMKGNFKPL